MICLHSRAKVYKTELIRKRSLPLLNIEHYVCPSCLTVFTKVSIAPPIRGSK